MALSFLVLFWILLRTICCQTQCIQEALDDAEFYINATEHIEVQSIDCIQIPHKVTFSRDKVTVPYRKILFEGDPSNVVRSKVVSGMDSDTFSIQELPHGEYEYGFKLEWGCNQTYVFPRRIHISVSVLTAKPSIFVEPMVEGQRTRLICQAPKSCSRDVFLYLKWQKADGQSTTLGNVLSGYDDFFWHSSGRYRNRRRYRDGLHIPFYPTADHHNTNITCVAEYDQDIAETTVTLRVEFSPRILNNSHCTVTAEQLICVCISWGNPLPPIFWPLETLTDYSVTSFSIAQTVRSTFTMPAAKYHNNMVKCMSSNELGQAESAILIPNSAEDVKPDYSQGSRQWFDSALPWIAGVCFTLNLVFVAVIICIHQRSQYKHKEPFEEVKTYASLRKVDVEEEYSVISPQCT